MRPISEPWPLTESRRLLSRHVIVRRAATGPPQATTQTTATPLGPSRFDTARPMHTRAPSSRRTTRPISVPGTPSISSASVIRSKFEPEASSRSEYVDAFGNSVLIFIVKGCFEHLSVTATSEVTVTPTPTPPPSPPWESAQWLLDIDRQAAARAARRFRAPSRLVPASPELTAYATESFSAGRPILDAVVDLSGRIHRDFKYEPGFTSVTTPVLEILQNRRGVCQDFAHLAIGCVRSMGLAARYVSGYLETVPPKGAPRLMGADASHAWFSVFIPGWGWVDVDPTNDQLVSDSHITTAWGRDYWDVSPLRGSLEGGGSSHSLDVAVDVTRLPEGPTPDSDGLTP